MATRKTFLAVPYTSRGVREDPIVNGVLEFDGKKFDIAAYCDTGVDAALSLSADLAGKYGMVPAKRETEEPHEVMLADGKIVGAYLYKVSLTIEGRTYDSLIPVVDNSIHLLQGKESETEDSEGDEPLLGRKIIDTFDVMFSGKSVPKSLRFEE
jgi:predicted aspartyl protease